MAVGYVKGSVVFGVAASYPYSTTVRIYGAFYNQSNQLTSPTAVSLRIKTPDGVENVVVPTNESLGIYYFETLVTQPNRWVYLWSGTGVLSTAGEFSFQVDPTSFTGVSGTSINLAAGNDQHVLYSLSGMAVPASNVTVAGLGTALVVGSGASAGLLRLQESQGGIEFRRNTGSTDVLALELEDDILYHGGDGPTTLPTLNHNFFFGASGGVVAFTDSTATDRMVIDSATLDATALAIKTTNNAQLGTSVATSGKLRLGNLEGGVKFRSGGVNIGGLELETDILYYGGDGSGASTSTLNHQFYFGSSGGVFSISSSAGPTDEFVVDSGTIDAKNNTLKTTGSFSGGSGTLSSLALTNSGSAAAPVLSAGNTPSLGMFVPSGPALGFGLGGIEQFRMRANTPSGATSIVGYGAAGDVALELGEARKGTGTASIDLHGDSDTFTDYGLRVIRNAGASGASAITHRGVGQLQFTTQDGGSMVFATSGTSRLVLSNAGLLRPFTDAQYDLASTSFRYKDIYASGQFVGQAGASGPAFSFAGDIDTGIFRYAADTLSVGASGIEIMRFPSTRAAVIGPDAPGNQSPQLTIGASRTSDGTNNAVGNTFLSLVGDTTNTAYGLRLLRAQTASGTSQILHKGGSELAIVTESPDAARINFATASTDRWYVQGSGTFTPAADATYDVGYTGLRARDIYASRQFLGSLTAGATAPPHSLAGDTTSGMFGSAGVLQFSTSGYEAFRLSGGASPVAALGQGISTGTAGLEVGGGRTNNGFSYIDLVGDTTFSDFGFRVARAETASGVSQIIHRGVGGFQITAQDAALISFATSNSSRWQIFSSGELIPAVDNSLDLGVSSNRPRDIFAARAFNAGATGSSYALQAAPTGISFFAAALKAKPTITGSRGGGSATAQLLTQLASYGLITDNSVA